MSSVERTAEFVAVGLFLSKYGEREGRQVRPPPELGVPSWHHAYAAFFDALGGGRPLRSFHNSLKATRDAFDSWVDSGRQGWRLDDGTPKPLNPIEERVFATWNERPREELWAYVAQFCSGQMAEVPTTVIADIEVETEPAPEGGARTEGGRRVYVSARVERSPALRAAALRIHGDACMVCGFSFAIYGDWGEGFAEVHHLVPLADEPGPRATDPATDLAVVCANCHRMIHRQRGRVLELDELRARIDPMQVQAWLQQLLTTGGAP